MSMQFYWRKGTLLARDQVYLSAAILAAQASYGEEGIRQRDLKFFFELFRSWSADYFHGEISSPFNAQVARAFKRLTAQGHAKSTRRRNLPRYKLTQSGVIETLRALTESVCPTRIEESLFVLYFISSYKEKLSSLVHSSMREYSPAAQAEIEALLDSRRIRQALLREIDKKIALFEGQILRNSEATTRALKLHSNGATAHEIATMLQRDFPYHLNAQRPLKELYPELPPDIALWEITEGPRKRAEMLWGPLLLTLKQYREHLGKI